MGTGTTYEFQNDIKKQLSGINNLHDIKIILNEKVFSDMVRKNLVETGIDLSAEVNPTMFGIRVESSRTLIYSWEIVKVIWHG